MKRTCVLAVLAACGGETKQEPPKQDPVIGDTPTEKPKRSPEPPSDYGSCTITVGGAITLEQTSPGGTSKSVTSYWFAADDKRNVMFPEGKIGLVLNCTDKQLSLNILTKLATKTSFPFGPKKYELKKSGRNELYVLGTIGKTSVMGATGTIDITTFDASRIAGAIDLKATTLPDDGDITLVGSFDFKCPGFSGCAK
jgi:hypothetical protein